MCRYAVLGLATLALAAWPLAAQGPAAEQALERRLDSIRSLMEAIPADRRWPPRLRGPAPRDTVMVRGLRVVAPPEDVDLVTSWADRVMVAYESRIGPVPSVPRPPTIEADWAPVTLPYSPDARSIRIRGYSADQVLSVFGSAIGEALARELTPPVRDWLAGPLGPRARAYTELAASPDPRVRACSEGDRTACLDVLGLAGTEPQVSPAVRRSYLYHVLRSRDGTFEALMTGGPAGAGAAGFPSAAATLQSAAGPLGQLAAEWQATLAGETPTTLAAPAVATSLLWILVMLGLATRSTRWRA